MKSSQVLSEFNELPLYLSSRIFEALLDSISNTLNNYDKADLAAECGIDIKELMSGKDRSISFEKLNTLLVFCRLRYNNESFFYRVGHELSEAHYYAIGKIITFLNSSESLTSASDQLLIDEQNFSQMVLKKREDNLHIDFTLHQICLDEFKNITLPVLSLFQGFCDRIMFEIFAHPRGHVLEKNESSLHLSYNIFADTDVSLIKYVDPSQLYAFRLDSYLSQTFEKSILDEISFYLTRDICFSIEEIAEKLNLSVRSLQRKLKEQRQTFSGIKEGLRKELVVTYFKDTSLSINEISDKMGYSERSAFERAFRKWFDSNPKSYRDKIFDLED